MKKYRIRKDLPHQHNPNLYRIEALKNFCDVRVGDLGGYVESERNLNHWGSAWIYNNAQVSTNAKVFESARIYDNAKVYGNARICGGAEIFGRAEVYGDAYVYNVARIHGNAWIYSNAEIYGNAIVYGYSKIYGNAKIHNNAVVYGNVKLKDYVEIRNSKDVINITGFSFNITVTHSLIFIGCKTFTFDQLDHIHKELPDHEVDCIKAMVEIAIERIYKNLEE